MGRPSPVDPCDADTSSLACEALAAARAPHDRMSNVINRFHATFCTEVDPPTRDALAPTCPLAYPNVPED